MDNRKIVAVFEDELDLNEKGFEKLNSEKKCLVIDVSTEEGFKLARKERAERNKIIDRIDRLAIDGKSSIDNIRASLKLRVSDAYRGIMEPFEEEDSKRKAAAKKKKEAEELRLSRIRDKIQGIADLAFGLHGKSSAELQNLIEAVDLIDIDESFGNLSDEASRVKKNTISQLGSALASAMQSESMAAEIERLKSASEHVDPDVEVAKDVERDQFDSNAYVDDKIIERMVSAGCPEDSAKEIIKMIVNGQVPNTYIKY